MLYLILFSIILCPVLAAPSSPKLVNSCKNNKDCSMVNIADFCKSFSKFYDGDGKYASPVLFQGDMILPHKYGRNGVTDSDHLWPDGKVAYVMKNYNPVDTQYILNIINEIEENTCVRFVPYTTESSYLSIQNIQAGCFSDVGRKPNSESLVNLSAPGCLDDSVVFHEILHALGLFHEQSRYDRDKYINVLWENVDPNHLFDFCLLDWINVSTYGLDYDLSSVMHYEEKAFSKNGKPTMEPKVTYRMGLFGNIHSPSPVDFEKIRRMYNC